MKSDKRLKILRLLYLNYLKREPEQNCINTYYKLTKNEKSIVELINIIKNSNEYKEKKSIIHSEPVKEQEFTNYHLHNSYHLGDNVFNLIFFNIIRRYIETKNIIIHYYCKDCYLDQLKEFIHSDNIHLKTLSCKPSNSVELWVNNRFFGYNHDLVPKPVDFNIFYVIFFNIVLEKLQFKEVIIKKLEYRPPDLLELYDNLNDKYKDVQILILNSQPLSGQYEYKKTEWDKYIKILDKMFKICTTTKVANINCTTDDKLSIKNIAALSIKVPVIIAVNSGVVPGLLNKYTLSNVKRFYVFDNRCYYSYPNFVSKNKITDIPIHELKTIIN